MPNSNTKKKGAPPQPAMFRLHVPVAAAESSGGEGSSALAEAFQPPAPAATSTRSASSSVELNASSANSVDEKPDADGESNTSEKKLAETKGEAKGKAEKETDGKTAQAFMPPRPAATSPVPVSAPTASAKPAHESQTATDGKEDNDSEGEDDSITGEINEKSPPLQLDEPSKQGGSISNDNELEKKSTAPKPKSVAKTETSHISASGEAHAKRVQAKEKEQRQFFDFANATTSELEAELARRAAAAKASASVVNEQDGNSKVDMKVDGGENEEKKDSASEKSSADEPTEKMNGRGDKANPKVPLVKPRVSLVKPKDLPAATAKKGTTRSSAQKPTEKINESGDKVKPKDVPTTTAKKSTRHVEKQTSAPDNISDELKPPPEEVEPKEATLKSPPEEIQPSAKEGGKSTEANDLKSPPEEIQVQTKGEPPIATPAKDEPGTKERESSHSSPKSEAGTAQSSKRRRSKRDRIQPLAKAGEKSTEANDLKSPPEEIQVQTKVETSTAQNPKKRRSIRDRSVVAKELVSNIDVSPGSKRARRLPANSSNAATAKTSPEHDSPAKSPEAKVVTRSFQINDRVEAKYRSRGRAYFPGTIVNVLASGNRYDVDYDDGDIDCGLSWVYIRKLNECQEEDSEEEDEEILNSEEVKSVFHVGDRVEAKYMGKGGRRRSYYPGTIAKVSHSTGEYDVDYDDSSKDVGLSALFIRKMLKTEEPVAGSMGDKKPAASPTKAASPKTASPKTASSKKGSSGEESFQIGDRIEAKFDGRGKKYYPGKIHNILPPGDRYDIDYDDGDIDLALAPKFIRRLSGDKQPSDDEYEEIEVEDEHAAAKAKKSPAKRKAKKPTGNPAKKRRTSAKSAAYFEGKKSGTWTERIAMLKGHKSKYGTCDLTHASRKDINPLLKSFVLETRKQYKKFQRGGEPTTMTAARITELEGLEFDFSPMTSGSSKDNHTRRFQKKWDDKFAELEKYKAKYGDCLVSCTSEVYNKLGNWVRGQRKVYNRTGREGFPPQRLAKLDDIGFDFDPMKSGSFMVKKRQTMFPKMDANWQRRYQTLLRFKKEKGYIIVGPATEGWPGLYDWLHLQRKEYKKWAAGDEKALMFDTWVAQMNELKFDWAPMSGNGFSKMLIERQSKHFDGLWNKHYENLKAFYEKHGHCYISRSSDDNTGLSSWIHVQRKHKRNLDRGKKATLTEERIKLLNDIGLDWNPSTSGGMQRKMQANRDKEWELTFEKLCAYKEEHGNANPKKAEPQLGPWTSRQRKLYAQNKAGQTTTLTDIKIGKLQSIGFHFDATLSIETDA